MSNPAAETGRRIQTKDDFEKLVVETMHKNPFLANIARYIRRLPTDEIPTAGVSYCKETDDLLLRYNLEFFSGLTRDQAAFVFYHELYHIIWKHLTRIRKPFMIWNYATDLSINSTLKASGCSLPEHVLLPGLRPPPPADFVKAFRINKETNQLEEYQRKLSDEEKNFSESLADLIENLPHGKASDWYFEILMQWNDQNGNALGDKQYVLVPGGLGDGDDDHSGWDSIPEHMKDLVEGKIRQMVQKAVDKADSSSDGWGSIPSGVREEIRKSVNNSVDWQKLLNNFTGMLARGERTVTFKRINKRYPYVHPGTKRGYRARVAVFVDQSGSVDDKSLIRVFGALNMLAKKVEFDVFHFDTEVDQANGFTWKKGKKFPSVLRTRCGGTDFNAPTNFVNDVKNRGRWDGYFIVTDGECAKPKPSRLKRAWIIVPGRKLLFQTDEFTVTMSKDEGKNS